ncbi:hypothetical protein DERF_014999 [Dermatophagoides farinae]|uniref:Uncharacterized protein n=1 Tax=Dermatophagoides farinae TaxID=6954 RepID=A0A922HP14_DERFA|nr:hypothetical protein DERF_014999 [Dermatophagoides farinae]
MFHFSWNETKIKSDEISSTKNKQQTTICLSLTLIRPSIKLKMNAKEKRSNLMKIRMEHSYVFR